MIEKQDTIAETMRQFMQTGPSTTTYPTYKALNDAVGKVHGLEDGKCQALAGEKAWVWAKDTTTGKWRKATDEEIEAKRTTAAQKNSGGSRRKAMSDADRAALDAQVTALEAVNNPALAPLLEELKARQAADDAARKGSLKDRLQACIDKLGLERAVAILEDAIAATDEATDEADA